MKKLVLTAAILMGFVMGSYAQLYEGNASGGLFSRGSIENNVSKGEDAGLWLPSHNVNGNCDADEEPILPLGSGALMLIGFGAAYALTKKNKKD